MVEISIDEASRSTLLFLRKNDKKGEGYQMSKKHVVKILKSIVLTTTILIGVAGFNSTVSASEVNTPQTKAGDIEKAKQQNEDLSSLLNIELGGSVLKPIIGDVSIDVLKKNEVQTVYGTETQTSLIDVIVKESKILGDTHVGVVEENKSSSKGQDTSYNGLVNIDLNNTVVGDAHVGVAENIQSTKEGENSSYNGIVNVGLKSTPVGDVDAGVLENSRTTTDDYTHSYNAVANIGVKDSILEDVHVGVIEKERVETNSHVWERNGVVVVEAKDTPIIGDLNTGVLVEEKYIEKNNSEEPKTPENPKTSENPKNPVTPEEPKNTENPKTPEDTKSPENPGNHNVKPTPKNSDKDLAYDNPSTSKKPTVSQVLVEAPDKEGQLLPKTATNVFNYGVIGLLLMLVGIALRMRKATA